MALSDQEVLKLAGAVLSAGVLDSNAQSKWFEKRNANSFVIDPKNVWGELNLLQDLPANNFGEAVSNAVANPNLIRMYGINDDGTYNDATAIRLTPLAGTNNKTYVAYTTYGDGSSPIIKNWIVPQLIPRASGAPSAAYQAQVWIGKPSDGQPLLSSAGSDGDWTSHVWNAAAGALLISEADAPPSTVIPSTDLYLTGFVYAGAGAGGGFSGSTILLEDPEGQWRIRNDYPHLLFERKELDDNNQPVWNTYSAMGDSIAVDGVKLSRPYDISVDLDSNLNDVTNPTIVKDYKSVFRVAGVNGDFIYGNSSQATILETKRGTEVLRLDAVRGEIEVENRPLSDVEVTLDSRDIPDPDTEKFTEFVSTLTYSVDADYLRINQLGFEVLEILDNDGNPVDVCPARIAVEDLNHNLIFENITIPALNSGIDGGFNLKEGYHFYPIYPPYTTTFDAVTYFKLEIANGYKVRVSGGMYDLTYQELDGSTVNINQFVTRQKIKVEFLNPVNVVDGSNIKDEIYKSSGIILEQGVNAYNPDFSDEQYPLVSTAEHTNAYMPVFGNYEDTSYLASGSGGVKVLFEDDTTRTQFWTEGDKERLVAGSAPQFWKEVTEIEIPISGVFTSELVERGWDVVNAERFIPLIRQESGAPIGYRVEITSTVVDYKFQESQDRFSFLDRDFRNGYIINPTIDVSEPEYVKLKLPRSKYTINLETPRVIKYFFSAPVKVFGYFKDPTDPQDPTTGTFVPSIKADVVRVYEESIVSGDDLDQKLSGLLGEKEWGEATLKNLPTLHVVPSLEWLTDEAGEVLLWSDVESLFFPTDEHQWLFGTGQEAYFELESSQGSWLSSRSIFNFNPVVVHIPSDDVQSFEVSFGWSSTFNTETNLDYGNFTLYIASEGRGFDSKITISIPRNASINWRFRRRRSGEYSYIATPMNDNLASTGLGSGNDLSNVIPVDNNPPIFT